MRDVTIKREKAAAHSRVGVSVYAEDRDAAELTIEGVPCRKLGELKNGEEQTFTVSSEAVTLYTAVDSRGTFTCQPYPLEAGEEAVSLAGCVCDDEDGRASFCFGAEGDGNADGKNKLKSALSLVVFIAIGALLGWLIGNLIFDGFPAPAKNFTADGYSIRLNEDFAETGLDAYAASFESDDVAVFSTKQSYEELGGKDAYTLQEYAQLMIEDNKLADSTVQTKRGVTYFEYEYTSESKIFSYHYTVAVHEGSDSYWLTYFAVDSEDYKEYKNDIFKWAASVQVP